MAQIEELRKEFQGTAEFAYVYIKEAHPDDEWQMDANLESDVVYTQPNTLESRMELARTFIDRMKIEGRTLVDDMANTANACFAAWPERLYVLDQSGEILYKGGMGPFYFDPDEVRELLEELKESIS